MRLGAPIETVFSGALRFWIASIGSLLAVLAILTVAGVAVIELTVSRPPDPFRTGSFEFNLAPGWWCDTEGAEYVCYPGGKPPYSAIAIMAVKERGADDNLSAYERHLREPKARAGKAGGGTTSSTVVYVKRIKLGHTEWIEALHRGSEDANYHTYYSATDTSHLGIVVTISANKDHESTYVAQFKEMMSSLYVYQN